MILKSARKYLRRLLFRFIQRVSATEDARAIAFETLRGLLQSGPDISATAMAADLNGRPYPELGVRHGSESTRARTDVIFITARFRSGSTFLWNVFRSLKGFTSYYEPLNERRWFDPALRGQRVDSTHKNVTDYWREYDGLPELGNWYREEWVDRNLFMDASFWDPGLQRYIEILIKKSQGRPVLQFNRVDFRLPWLRRNFPGAKLIHLFRHPRDQWCSALMDLKSFPRDASTAAFEAQDKFYLLRWARDLKYHFPFLDERHNEHPYDLFYYIWKLSYLFGKKYAHISVSYEEIIKNPRPQLQSLFHTLGMDPCDLEAAVKLVEQPKLGKWREFADDDWFQRRESACEQVLHEFFAARVS